PVSRKRSPAPSAATICSRSVGAAPVARPSVPSVAGVVISVMLVLRAIVEEGRDAHPFLDRVVVMEGQGRRPFHPLLGGDARLDHTVRGTQCIQRSVAL